MLNMDYPQLLSDVTIGDSSQRLSVMEVYPDESQAHTVKQRSRRRVNGRLVNQDCITWPYHRKIDRSNRSSPCSLNEPARWSTKEICQHLFHSGRRFRPAEIPPDAKITLAQE